MPALCKYQRYSGLVNHVRYGEGIFVGYRGYDARRLPVSYPFGHRLSCTTFDYTELATDGTGRAEDDSLVVSVSCRVVNTGPRAGREAAQLYLHDPVCAVAQPPRELRGFAKTAVLEPGQGELVSFRLSAREAVGYLPNGSPRGILGDDEMIRVIGNSPLSSLVAFPGLGIDQSTVDQLVVRLPAR